MTLLIPDRATAGRDLARALLHYRKQRDVLVLALPRGGVPVAVEVARVLHAPLDVMIVRKLGAPGHEELAIGAIASGGIRVMNDDIVASLGLEAGTIESIVARERLELERRMKVYRGVRPWPDLTDRRVILVDDGVATGASMHAAISAVRAQGPSRLVVAVPVAPFETLARLRQEADQVVCLETPYPFGAVGTWYESFPQLSDKDVRVALAERWNVEDAGAIADAAACALAAPDALTNADARRLAARPCHTERVAVEAGRLALEGTLTLPGPAHGVVVFVQSADSRAYDCIVADRLNAVGFATLQFDLLTPPEQKLDYEHSALRYDMALLTGRLAAALDWLQTHPALHGLPVGLFGTGAAGAAALCAAAQGGDRITAVVLRGSRPDLAMPSLPRVRAPTLLIVGGADETLLQINRRAAKSFECVHRLEVIPGASHLFEEEGPVRQVAKLAGAWFERYVRPAQGAASQPAGALTTAL
jgi:putative phosphoribosyl transferase